MPRASTWEKRHDGWVFADSGSARIAYDVEGDGPDVLLLHAGVTDRRSWAPLRERLGGRYRTIAYDRRGFGASTWTAEHHVEMDDALAVLDAAGARSAIVIGASNGGDARSTWRSPTRSGCAAWS